MRALNKQKSPAVCRAFLGALGRTRTCDLLIRSQTRSRTGGDREGHGETKPRFYRRLSVLKGQGRTGRDTGLWYRCGTKGERHSLGYPVSRKLRGHKKQLSLKSRGQSVRWPPGSAVPEGSVEDN